MNPLPKRRGELAELRFLLRAAEEGLAVSKPYGDSEHFDFVVGSHQPLYRVQVRSTSMQNNTTAFTCPLTWGKLRRAYSRRDFDYIAVYVVPLDTWYIIPSEAFHPNQKQLAVYPHVAFSSGRFEPFCEAWHLLRRPKPRTKARKNRPRLRRQAILRRAKKGAIGASPLPIKAPR